MRAALAVLVVALAVTTTALGCGGGDSGGSLPSGSSGGGASGSPDSPSTTSDDDESLSELELDITGFELIGATGRVDGLSPGGAFMWAVEEEAGFVLTTGLQGYSEDVNLLSGENVSCTFLPPTGFVLKGSTILLEAGGEETFTASFFASSGGRVESLSISSNASGSITGGYSAGDGSRTDGTQWPIFGDGWAVFGGEPVEDVAKYSPPLVLDPTFDGFAVYALWSGESVDDFSDQMASGTVVVACFFKPKSE